MDCAISLLETVISVDRGETILLYKGLITPCKRRWLCCNFAVVEKT